MDIRIHSTADRERLSQGVQVRYTTGMELHKKGNAGEGRQRASKKPFAAPSPLLTAVSTTDEVEKTAAVAAAAAAVATAATVSTDALPTIVVSDSNASIVNVVPNVAVSNTVPTSNAHFQLSDSEGTQTPPGH